MAGEPIAFLPARLNDDERLARAATPDNDSWTTTRMGSITGSAIYDDQWRLVSTPLYNHCDPTGSALTNGPAYLGDDVLSEHITRHDPGRALYEVEATRRILEEHTPTLTNSSCRICTIRDASNRWQPQPCRFPCATVRLLVLPCADHPEYRDE